jgi:NAD(P)-dependent dehydrogenase (short-subunit alcohol dehydrogenase family)
VRKLDGKVAVITGAASGIGRATALRFAAEGASVVIADLNQNEGEATAFQCREAGGLAVFQNTDVAQEEQIQAAIERAVGEFGRLDILFNNAGLAGAMGPIEEIGAQEWDRTMAILLRAAFLGIKHAVAHLRKSGGGSIISTASVAGLRAAAGPLAYSVAKAGIIHLTKCAAEELGKDLIRVNCICPGGIVTPLLFSHVPGGADTVRHFLDNIQPLPRAGEPEDVAAMALFLASDDARWITGTAMVVDGGLTTGGGGAIPAGMRGPWRTRRWSGPSFE